MFNPQTCSFHHSRKIDVDHLFPNPLFIFPKWSILGDTGIVDNDIDSAKMLVCGSKELGLLIVVCDIALDKERDLFLFAV